MEILDYVREDETILAETSVYDDPYALFFSGKGGSIVCTENRVIHADGEKFEDFSINRVDSIKYHPPKMPSTYLYSGIIVLGVAMLGFQTLPNFSTLGIVSGAVLLAVGYWLRTSVLTVRTPSKTFTFKSRDSLAKVAHALREREMST